MHDPRIKVGVGLGYAVSPYGADHMYAAHDTMFSDVDSFSFKSILPLGIYRPMSPTQITSDKIRSYVRLDRLWKMMDALGLCVFGFAPRGTMTLETLVQCIRAVTGWDTGLYELMEAAERGSLLARAFNFREGFTVKDDRLPQRLFEPKPGGPEAGKQVFQEKDFYKAVKLYYEMIGCDPESGRPLRGKLMELGLEEVNGLLGE